MTNKSLMVKELRDLADKFRDVDTCSPDCPTAASYEPCADAIEAILAKHSASSEAGEAPIPMVLHCPNCGLQHVDAPEPLSGWTNPPHKSHLCHGCGTVWRPADVATNGVTNIATRGTADTWTSKAIETKAEPVAWQFRVAGETFWRECDRAAYDHRHDFSHEFRALYRHD